LEILLNPVYCLLVQEHAFCFLHLLLNLTHTDSPLPTSTGRAATPLLPMPAPYCCAAVLSLLVGILSDLTEIGGSFRLLRVARRLGEGVIAGRARPIEGTAGCCQAAPSSSAAGLPESVVPLLCVASKERRRVKTAYFKSIFQVFQMFQRYVASVVYRCCKSRSGCCIYWNGYTHMFQMYVPNVSSGLDVC
jgi:hypothetical protein